MSTPKRRATGPAAPAWTGRPDGPFGEQRILVYRWDVLQRQPSDVERELLGSSYRWALVVAFSAGRPLGADYVQCSADCAERLRSLSTSWFRGPVREPSTGSVPSVSVVVPSTFRRRESLRRTLDALLRQTAEPIEIIFVDNRPSEDKADFLSELSAHERVSVLPCAKMGAAAARNVGLRAAVGEVVAFTDDDAEPDERWVEEVGRAVVRGNAPPTLLVGLILPRELESPAQVLMECSGSLAERRYEPYTYSMATSSPSASFTGPLVRRFQVVRSSERDCAQHFVYQTGPFGMSMNMAARKDVLEALGGFDEMLGTGTPCAGGEDIELVFRAFERGGTLLFWPDGYVWHSGRASMKELEEQMRGYGIGLTAALAALVRQRPIHLAGLVYFSCSLVARRLAGAPPSESSGRFPKDSHPDATAG